MDSPAHETDGLRRSADEEERFVFTLPARLEYRDAARAFLAYVCDRLTARQAMPEDIGHQVISAFVEAFNNAVLHAYRDLLPGPVEVEMRVSSLPITPDKVLAALGLVPPSPRGAGAAAGLAEAFRRITQLPVTTREDLPT